MKYRYIYIIVGMIFIFSHCRPKQSSQESLAGDRLEDYRPLYHFTPTSGWMNDPNGMVFLDGEYHLFYQHNPDSTVWGPMHWGHAISKDMITWEELPIALFPDSLGTIFSGSIVVDRDNTAGFGANALIAIFTHHNHEIENKKTGLHEYQSIAYSTDKGRTWIKYHGNPVLPNPGIWDYRDPKVMWHESSKQWVMTLATKQTITFYGSKNLKEWYRLSEFGEGVGAHGGVWECPDLLKFSTAYGDQWVLLVSINPGGPNTGSATQYFVGQFDGEKFITDQQEPKWMDFGPDNYAGVTFSNLANRNVLIGWMSNWAYAGVVPAGTWRSGMTIPRELELISKNGEWLLTSTPIKELESYSFIEKGINNKSDVLDISVTKGTYIVEVPASELNDFTLIFSNDRGDELLVGFDKDKNEYYIDRSKSGNTTFSEAFVPKIVSPRLSTNKQQDLKLVFDRNSVELFADEGTSNLSALFFVKHPFNSLKVISETISSESLIIKNIIK